MRSGKITPSKCPACREVLDGVTDPTSNKTPKVGDYSICAYCATVLVFGDGLVLRFPTDEERERLERDPQGRMLQAVMRHMVRDRARDN